MRFLLQLTPLIPQVQEEWWRKEGIIAHTVHQHSWKTQVNTLLKTLFLNSLLKASFTFVLGEILLQPSRFFIVNTILRNGPSQEWSWSCILVILRKRCRSIKNPWNIVPSVSKWSSTSCHPPQFCQGSSLSSQLNHMRQFFLTSWQMKKKNSFDSYIS